jgi:DNA polymerase-3 subunit gamma/tau
MSLYNKYRPKNFDQLVSSKYNTPNKEQIKSHHAFLFFGSPGTGKTSSARLYMQEFVKDSEKASVIDGKHPDYVEINCAVNNGVDDIRTIVSDVVNTVPISADYKFIVMDESHMLSTQSQNALLKTVEEPPKHIKFIFCTTEINKVLPAIRSRCQIVPFIKINDQLLLKILNNIVDGEQLNANTESLNLIVSCSEGSARNAINLLEQCSLLLADPKAVANVLGTANSVSFDSLTQAICNKDRVKSLLLLEELITNAIDQNSIINKYADYLADLIILRIVDKSKCKFDGKSLLIISEGITNILKDFKILQNIKLISKIHVLKVIDLL